MSGRSQSLDVLRGLAVLFVLLSHFPVINGIEDIGGTGVELFFVLSGFLISGLLFREYQQCGEINVKRFYLRRGLKIWPSFYIYLGAVSLFSWRYASSDYLWKSVRWSSVYLLNYWGLGINVTRHTWSLAVEEHFYLLLPLLLLFLIFKNWLRLIPVLAAISLVFCLGFRWHDPSVANSYRTHCRIDALLLGVGLSYLRGFKERFFSWFARPWLLPFSIACLLANPFLGEKMADTFGFAILPIGFCALIAWAVSHEPHGLASKILRPLSQLGVYSYSVYLWQQPFAPLGSALGGVATKLLLIVLAVSVGVSMSLLVERPVLTLRDRFFPARGAALKTSSCSRTALRISEAISTTN